MNPKLISAAALALLALGANTASAQEAAQLDQDGATSAVKSKRAGGRKAIAGRRDKSNCGKKVRQSSDDKVGAGDGERRGKKKKKKGKRRKKKKVRRQRGTPPGGTPPGGN